MYITKAHNHCSMSHLLYKKFPWIELIEMKRNHQDVSIIASKINPRKILPLYFLYSCGARMRFFSNDSPAVWSSRKSQPMRQKRLSCGAGKIRERQSRCGKALITKNGALCSARAHAVRQCICMHPWCSLESEMCRIVH